MKLRWAFPKGFLIDCDTKPYPYPFLLSTLELSIVLIEQSLLYWLGPGLSLSCSKNRVAELPNDFWVLIL